MTPSPLDLHACDSRSLDLLALNLADFALFSGLDAREARLLASHMLLYGARQGTTIFAEGDPGNFLCLILEGRTVITKQGDDGQPHTIGTVGPGKTIGEMALIDGEPRSASCSCQTDVELALLSKSNFDKLVQTAPLLGYKVMARLAKLLSQRLRQTTGQLVDHI